MSTARERIRYESSSPVNQQHHLDVRLQVELAALKASLYLYPLYIIKLPEKYLYHDLKCVDVTECDLFRELGAPGFRGHATKLVKDIVVNA